MTESVPVAFFVVAVGAMLPSSALGIYFITQRVRGRVFVPEYVAKHGWKNLDGDEKTWGR